jgi:hypothetical protein
VCVCVCVSLNFFAILFYFTLAFCHHGIKQCKSSWGPTPFPQVMIIFLCGSKDASMWSIHWDSHNPPCSSQVPHSRTSFWVRKLPLLSVTCLQTQQSSIASQPQKVVIYIACDPVVSVTYFSTRVWGFPPEDGPLCFQLPQISGGSAVSTGLCPGGRGHTATALGLSSNILVFSFFLPFHFFCSRDQMVVTPLNLLVFSIYVCVLITLF